MTRSKKAEQSTDTGTLEPEIGAIYAFIETHTKATIETLKAELQTSLASALATETQRVEERAKQDIQAQAEKVRDQVLTALGLFAALFSILSASSLVLTRAATVPELIAVLCTISITLLLFLALFFAFLHNRTPALKVIWLPLLFFLGLMVALIWAFSRMPASEGVSARKPQIQQNKSDATSRQKAQQAVGAQ